MAPSPFLVTNTMDNLPGQPLIDGSLRQAIVQSDSTPGPNEIDFASGLSGTAAPTSGESQITNDVTIVGPGGGCAQRQRQQRQLGVRGRSGEHGDPWTDHYQWPARATSGVASSTTAAR